MATVAPTALERAAGKITSEEFWQLTGDRLSEPRFEMDAATSHHLYADLLAERFPHAVFIHTVRDARSWVNSMLDMTHRKAVARRQLREPWDPWEHRTVDLMFGGVPLLDMYDDGSPDTDAVAPLLVFWADHMRRVSDVIPKDRLLRLRVNDIANQSASLAEFVGVNVSDLRLSHSHSNRSPLSFDRFHDPTLNDLYVTMCADIEKDFGCARIGMTASTLETPQEWEEHANEVAHWAQEAIATHGRGVAR